jgi:hypothetical protein
MKQKGSILAIIFFNLLLGSNQSFSQSLNQLIKGNFSGSYENYSQYYLKDDKIGALLPLDKIGSNGFLKLDYNYGKFSAGAQFESYLPAILGYFPIPVDNQSKIVNKYFKYTDEKFSVQVGDFYEQFGSGLIFRAFENRQIGINNAVEGFNIHVNPTDFFRMKIIYGRTRQVFEYAKAVNRGVDTELDVNQLFGRKNDPINFTVGGSYFGKYQDYTGPLDKFPSTVHSFAGRVDINANDFSLSSEYVEKASDPNLLNNQSFDKGKAFQVNGSFTKNNFGATATFRSVYNMNATSDRNQEFTSIAPLNYVPALTKQHDYLTSNIYVYGAQVKGEVGFQSDVYYNIKSGTKLGGKYGTKISANFSMFNALKESGNITDIGKKKYFSDANIEIKKKFTKQMEMTLGLQQIFYNSAVIQAVSNETVLANVVALGGLYKWKSKKSVRVKLEHLASETDSKSWASGLAEFSFSSPYAFFVSDLYNYGKTKNHYYNFGASVTKKSTRFSLSFGKQRAGLFCVGGICRFVPASYGFTAGLTTSF